MQMRCSVIMAAVILMPVDAKAILLHAYESPMLMPMYEECGRYLIFFDLCDPDCVSC